MVCARARGSPRELSVTAFRLRVVLVPRKTSYRTWAAYDFLKQLFNTSVRNSDSLTKEIQHNKAEVGEARIGGGNMPDQSGDKVGRSLTEVAK